MADALKLALFDCDGTLVDSQHAIVACMERAFAAEGLAPPATAAVRAVVGLSLHEAVRRLRPDEGEARVSRLVEGYKRTFAADMRAKQTPQPLFPGVSDALETLGAAGVLLGIATGKSLHGVRAVLDRHALLDRFVTVQTPDTAPGKPHPGMVLQAAAAVGATPADVVVVGDTVFDIAMARAAGAASVGVTWGYHDAQALRSAGADRLVNGFGDVPEAVLSLLGD